MNWSELLQWSRMGFIACCALAVEMMLSLAMSQHARELELHRGANRMVPIQSVMQPVHPTAVHPPMR